MSETIVVGYDGEEPAQRALERAIAEARASSARLVVVAVAEMPLNPEGPQSFGSLDAQARMLPLVEPPALAPLLARARELVEAAGVEAEYVWAVGEPASAIAGTAHDREASLIVVGSHHGFIGRLLGTDVAAEVRRETECDVLVVD